MVDYTNIIRFLVRKLSTPTTIPRYIIYYEVNKLYCTFIGFLNNFILFIILHFAIIKFLLKVGRG
jgi:hypothetical protein